MSIIKIKRSGTSGSPSALAQGELAYSYLAGDVSNGGDRLYIGTGTETNGEAANIEVIGGKYFTQKLDHTPGTLTSNSAIIVDASSKIDILNVDNITINGNEISSTDTNGNIVLNPDGTGSIDASSARIINLANPTANTDAVTLQYLESTFSANLSIAGDSGTDVISLLNETLTFVGDTGITTTVSSNTVTIDLDDTAVTPGSYGNTTHIPTFTVDQQGRLTAAGTANVATQLTIGADTGSDDTVNLLTDVLVISGNTGITTTVSNNQIDVDLNDTAVTPGTYGNTSYSVTFTVDQQGRLTAASGAAVAITSSQVTDFTEAAQDAAASMITGATHSGLTVSYNDSANTLTFNVNDPVITLSGDVAGSATMTNLGNVTITTTIQANSVALGTDTTGDYVASLVAGTGVTLSNNSGESATPTIAIGQDVANTANVTFQNITATGSVQIDGDLTVGGNTVTLNVTNLDIEDNMIYLNNGSAVTNPDLGIVGSYNDGTAAHAGIFRDASDGIWKFFQGYTPDPDADVYIDTSNNTFTLSTVQANTFIGGLQGNANTASKLETARTISIGGDVSGSVSFDGSQNVTITVAQQNDSVDLGTHTTGQYAKTIAISGVGLTTNAAAVDDGTAYTIVSSANSSAVASTIVYRDSDRNFSANTITANVAGNANTASTLLTSRTITLSGDVAGSVSFDGSQNVTISTTIQSDSVALGTDTTGDYVASVGITAGTGLSVTGTGEGATVTLAGVNATDTVKGVASFSNTNFTVTSGAVTISAIDGGTY